MALHSHPKWKKCLKSLADKVDDLYLRFDMRTGDMSILPQIEDYCKGKLRGLLKSDIVWNNHNWKEELLRMMDNTGADIVLFPDEDEEFEDGVEEDIKNFINGPYKELMFGFKTIIPKTRKRLPKRKGIVYPCSNHCKIFKWKPGLTYIPYPKRACLASYVGYPNLNARSKIIHWHFYPEYMYDKWSRRLYNQDKIDENEAVAKQRQALIDYMRKEK